MRFDLPLEELRHYRPDVAAPADFDAFWQRTLADAARHPIAAEFRPLTDPIYQLVDVYDVTFAGFDGQPVKGWLLAPAGTTEPRPCIVSFVGYGGGRSLPIDHIAPAVAGFAHLVMDTRGQGSGWSPGDTHDNAPAGPHYAGFLTRGIESPDTYYYRRVFTDAVRAVEAAATHPHVDAERIAVAGGSQGGGIALAAAALATPAVKLLLADVPFLCHFRRATELTDAAPYNEIVAYLRCHRDREDAVFATLSYFDGIHFAQRVTARSLFSVGLMDLVCPPSTVFAAYNQLRGPKDIRVYGYNEHEGGGSFQAVARLHYAAEHL